MKKIIIFTMVLCLALSSSFAQVKYTSAGNFGIGTTSPLTHLHLDQSTPTMFMDASLNYDSYIRFGANPGTYQGGYIKFDGSSSTEYLILGYHNSTSSSTAYDKHVLKINATNGGTYLYPQSTATYASGFQVVAPQDYSYSYLVNRGGYFNFIVEGRGKVWYQTLSQLSDESVKEEVTDIVDAKNLISQLRPVKFKYKAEAFGSDVPYSDYNYGLIAQEVEQVLPDIVSERYDGKKGVSYTDLIPLLIVVVNEQQKDIEDLKYQIQQLEGGVKKSEGISTLDISESITEATLSQNTPNPFKESTKIRYSLPEIESNSMVNIYDLQGKQIKSFQINQPGIGEIEIPGSSFSPGIYIYNLILDDQIIDTKRMILTE